jgi:hypothetical protein
MSSKSPGRETAGKGKITYTYADPGQRVHNIPDPVQVCRIQLSATREAVG